MISGRARQQKAKEEQQAFSNAVSSHAQNLITKYEALRQEFSNLNGDTKKQADFVRTNADAFSSCVEVKNVRDENLFGR